jgi:replicative DNA helicase
VAVERSLISRVVVRPDDLPLVLRQGVRPNHFHDEELQELWQFIVDHYAEYGRGPDREALALEFGEMRYGKPQNSTQYYIDTLLNDHRLVCTREMLAEAAVLVKGSEDEKGDHEAALRLLHDSLITIEQETSLTEDSDTADATAAFERFRNIEERGVMTGIPSGFPFIDAVTGGLQVEQFIVIAGPQKAGKSSILLKMAVAAQLAGYKVLFFSFEMSNEEQENRYWSLSAGVSLFNLTQGGLKPKDWTALDAARVEVEALVPLTWVHDMRRVTTLAGIEAKIDMYSPDIVFVDGMYLMDAEVPGTTNTDTKALTVVSRGMKRMAQNLKITVVGSTQALEWKIGKKQGITTNAIGYTSGFGQDADLLIGLEHAVDQVARMRIMDARNAERQETHVKFDWSKGIIEEDAEWVDKGDDSDDLD